MEISWKEIQEIELPEDILYNLGNAFGQPIAARIRLYEELLTEGRNLWHRLSKEEYLSKQQILNKHTDEFKYLHDADCNCAGCEIVETSENPYRASVCENCPLLTAEEREHAKDIQCLNGDYYTWVDSSGDIAQAAAKRIASRHEITLERFYNDPLQELLNYGWVTDEEAYNVKVTK